MTAGIGPGSGSAGKVSLKLAEVRVVTGYTRRGVPGGWVRKVESNEGF